MEKLDFKFIFSELERIRDKVVKEYMEIYKARGNSEKIGVYNSTIFGNRIGNAIDYLNGVCGGAYISFRDRRSNFYKQYKAWYKNLPENRNNKWLEIHRFNYPHSGRQELEVNEAVAKACCEYINKNCGANCRVGSYID